MARRKKINVDKCSNEIKNKNVKNQLKKKPGRKPGPKAKAKSPNVAQVIASVSNSLSDCESTEEIDHGLQILSNSSEHPSLTRSISSVSTDGTSDSDIDWEDDLSKLKKVNLAEVRAKEKARQKENEDPSTNDFDVKKMHEISRQYANNFAKNLDSSNQYEYYQERIRQLEEQLKDHNKKLNSQKSPSIQQPLSIHPSFGFQQPPSIQQQPFGFQQPPNFPSPYGVHQNSYGANQHLFGYPFLNFQHHGYNNQPYHFAPPLVDQVQQPINSETEENKAENLDDDLEKRIRGASEMACSDANFSVKLLEIFFKKEELNQPNLNVYGKQFKGSDNHKIALDEKRVALIKDRVLQKVNGDCKYKKIVWTSCVSAMNKKLGQLRVKNQQI